MPPIAVLEQTFDSFCIIMAQCVVFGCRTRRGEGQSMFSFPKDKKLMKIWTLKVNREGFHPDAHSRPLVCEKHFEKLCFTTNYDIGKEVGRTLHLKRDAVPTLFMRGEGKGGNGSIKPLQSLAVVKRKNWKLLLSQFPPGDEENTTLVPSTTQERLSEVNQELQDRVLAAWKSSDSKIKATPGSWRKPRTQSKKSKIKKNKQTADSSPYHQDWKDEPTWEEEWKREETAVLVKEETPVSVKEEEWKREEIPISVKEEEATILGLPADVNREFVEQDPEIWYRENLVETLPSMLHCEEAFVKTESYVKDELETCYSEAQEETIPST